MNTNIQCEYCGEVPILGDCPHGCHERLVRAGRNGRDIYCLYCLGNTVLIAQEYVYKGDPDLDYGNRRCDWCRRVIV